MTNNDLISELKKVELEFKHRTDMLVRKFVEKNAMFKVGDKIRCKTTDLYLEVVSYKPFFSGMKGYAPEPIYFGYILNKDGTRKAGLKMDTLVESQILITIDEKGVTNE